MEKETICKCGHPKSEHMRIELVSDTTSEIKNGVSNVKKTIYKNTFDFNCSKCNCSYREVMEDKGTNI